MRKPVLKQLFENSKAIPVERAMDQAKLGKGTIKLSSAVDVAGDGTEFTKQCNVGDSIKFISRSKDGETFEDQIIEKILDDQNIVVKAPGVKDWEASVPSGYKVLPKLD
jgi:hypothetical protein